MKRLLQLCTKTVQEKKSCYGYLKIVLFLLILQLPQELFGQSGYYSTDSTTFYGAKVLPGSDRQNAQKCRVEYEGKILEFTPEDVSEYGFDDGRVFVAKTIQEAESKQKVFLERVTNGKITLYYYNGIKSKTYFLEKDSALFVELPQKDDEKSYKDQLTALTSDCPSVSDACKLVRYNRNSLSKFFKQYDNCELKPFPYFRYGITIGYEYSKIIPAEGDIDNIEYFDFDYDGGLSFGVFIEQPILVSDFSLFVELNYVEHGYSYNKWLDNKDIDFVANLSQVKLPFMVRYRMPANKIRPYVNAGLLGSYNIKNSYVLYDARINGNTIELGMEYEDNLYDSVLFGYCIGGGVEVKVYQRYTWFMEFRYFKQNWLVNSDATGNQNFGIFTGINF